jgi:hypothetical protein
MIEEAIRRAIECNAMLYNRKRNCAESQRDAELRWIYELAEIAPDGKAVECGVWEGGSLVCWAMAREGRGPLIAVDIDFKPEFDDNLDRYGLFVRKVRSTTEEAAAIIRGRVAFCFIDSDHRSGIGKDIKVWPDKIMPNGVIAFHDYGVWKPWIMVKKEVDKWQKEAGWELLGQVGSLIGFRKPK